MLKQQVLVAFTAMLFAMSSSIMAEKGEDDHKGMEHPAHEMGDAVDNDAKEQPSEAYKENLEEAEDAANQAHPAHKMDESEEELRERGQ